MSFDIGGTGAVDGNAAKFSAAAALDKVVAIARFQLVVVTASTVLTAKYRVGGGTGRWENRWLLALRYA